ncbi:MAG: GlmU family protein [Phycisphaerales bacterium]
MPLTLIFDGDRPLAPLTDLRPVYRIRTGVMTTIERWRSVLKAPIDAVWPAERLLALEREVAKVAVRPDLSGQSDVLLLNGACVLPPSVQGLALGEWIACERGTLLAARLSGADALGVLESGHRPDRSPASVAHNAPCLARACDIIRLRDEAMEIDLHHCASHDAGDIPAAVHRLGSNPVVLSDGCDVGPGVVLDASDGPVYIAPHARVRPHATLIGPCAVLEGATVLDGALIRAHTVIGPHCKAAGEIGGTIFQGYANKGHDGYLGDAYVGEWVNLGAGTNNSNLLNTYGVVKAAAHLGAEREPTGLTFFGCVLGDHAKTAIGSRLMTGTLVGTGAMCAATPPPPSVTDRFLWLTDSGASRYRWSKFEEVARAVMARRDVAPSDAYLDTLRSLHGGDAS